MSYRVQIAVLILLAPNPAQAGNFQETSGDYWAAIPGMLWFALALLLLLLLQGELRDLIRDLSWRMRSGAAVKIGSIELGAVTVVEDMSHREVLDVIGSEDFGEGRAPAPGGDWERARERRAYYFEKRRIMLVHKLFRSSKPGQLYDVLIYVIPHREGSLAGVMTVEYFFGHYWGDRVFSSTDRGRGFPVKTSAYGPFLCTAKVIFNDEEHVMLHRYIDFEMGAYAPATRGKS
jgi:hypothetical protein